MNIPLWRKYRDRADEARAAAEKADRVHKRVEAQWPEVLRRAEWAREQRQRNHLTDLFFDLRGGKST